MFGHHRNASAPQDPENAVRGGARQLGRDGIKLIAAAPGARWIDHRDRVLTDRERTDTMTICVSRGRGGRIAVDL